MKEYWENVFRARKEIYATMRKFGVTAVMVDEFNPCCNQISENGGIGLEFSYGFPYRLYTQLGCVSIISNCIFGDNEEEILKEMTEAYGLIEVSPKLKTILGERGPVYAITRLPWTEEKLPVFEKRKELIKSDEARRAYNIEQTRK